MKRRRFILNTGLITVGSLGLSWIIQSCREKATDATSEEEAVQELNLEEVTIDELQDKMQSGELTSRAIAEYYINRIQMFDKGGPELNSVIELNPEALSIAEAMDNERKQKKVRGILHGIPVLIKDNIDTADKMMTTAGSLALEGNFAEKDATIVAQLRRAGAVIIGKTNLSEWANFRSTRSSSGWSSRGGQTRNPYALHRSPCGSSSGSGVAVAANLCAIAIGTETNGSIACPSSINGIVGIKPTVGLWSRTGIIPISHTQDTAGPMARTVRDAAILLGALSEKDEEDAATLDRPSEIPPGYVSFLKDDALNGKVIGVEKSYLKGHEAIDKLLSEAIAQLKERGAKVVEVDFLDKLKKLTSEEFDVLKYEFKDGINKYLSKSKSDVKSLTQLIEFNKKNEQTVMPHFKQEILEASNTLTDLTSKPYKAALERLLTTHRKAFADIFKQHNLNALVGPANGPSWCIDLINGDSFTGYGMYSSAAIAGYPSITVPMGMVEGLPIGLSFLGLKYSEPELLGIAYAYEQVSKHRVAPVFETEVAEQESKG